MAEFAIVRCRRHISNQNKMIRKTGVKYGNKKYGTYASKKEYNRAQALKAMERQGLISNLREQVSYTIIPSQYEVGEPGPKGGKPKQKCIEHACRYVADFVYDDADGNTIVEDTKGFRTKDYIIKRKLMLFVYGIKIKET